MRVLLIGGTGFLGKHVATRGEVTDADSLTGHPPLLTHEVVDVFREDWAYQAGQAERELGYTPTPLKEGLRRTVAWLPATGMA